MLNIFKKKKEPIKPPEFTQRDQLLELNVEVLKIQSAEQRLMIKQLLKITTMLSEFKKYELISKELTVLKNMIDKIK
jgi:hypothetical protein